MEKILLVGCGNMGFAMLEAWLDKGRLSAENVVAVEPAQSGRQKVSALGVKTVESAEAVPGVFQPDLIIFAVKPQIMNDVVPAYAGYAGNAVTFLSIAAGTRIETIAGALATTAPIVRCMPNTPAAIGKGMMVLVANSMVGKQARETVTRIFQSNGAVEWIEDEDLMDAVTAVSGSGPAYVFHFIECLADAARQVGLPAASAERLAMQTVYGAACLAFESGEAPGVLREHVTSPKGTTAAALDAFMTDNRLRKLVTDAVRKARDRGRELGKPQK